MRTWLLALFCLAAFVRPAAAQEVLFVVRHAEKLSDAEDAPLSSVGEARARRLADLLRDAHLSAIYTSLLKRAIATATPLSTARHLPITRLDGRKIPELVSRIQKEHQRDRVLVVGHTNTIPELLAAYGLERIPDLPALEYDNLYIVYPQKAGPATLVRLRY
jgi:broad specificity phosphatase PhoE